MQPAWDLYGVACYHGHSLELLRSMEANSVHCAITSPPYFGLRDYNLPPMVWGGDPACEHVFDEETVDTEIGRGNWSQATNGRGEVQGELSEFREPIRSKATRGFCRKCRAWLGSLGLEPTPDLYIAHSVELFREVRRVLRPDAWRNS